jgi:hypothetical protein
MRKESFLWGGAGGGRGGGGEGRAGRGQGMDTVKNKYVIKKESLLKDWKYDDWCISSQPRVFTCCSPTGRCYGYNSLILLRLFPVNCQRVTKTTRISFSY